MAKCYCENSKCDHKYQACKRKAVVKVHTVYGPLNMCKKCAGNMPQKYVRYEEPL